MKDSSTGIESRRLLYPLASLLLFLPIFYRFYWPAADGLDVTGQQIGRDFINVWAAPQLAFEGHIKTLFDMQGYHEAIGALFGHRLPFHNWSYPLFTLPLFWPLTQLPYFVALAVWTLGLWGAFAAITLSQVERPNRSYALLALLFAPACLINVVNGQNGFLSAALMLTGVICLERRPVMAGILFGLLAFKPQLALGPPFTLFALGAWRVMAATTFTAILLVAGSVALFGIEPWQQYFDVTGAYQVLLLRDFQGFYTTMMVSAFAGARTWSLIFGRDGDPGRGYTGRVGWRLFRRPAHFGSTPPCLRACECRSASHALRLQLRPDRTCSRLDMDDRRAAFRARRMALRLFRRLLRADRDNGIAAARDRADAVCATGSVSDELARSVPYGKSDADAWKRANTRFSMKLAARAVRPPMKSGA